MLVGRIDVRFVERTVGAVTVYAELLLYAEELMMGAARLNEIREGIFIISTWGTIYE
jgi:hypothetical protein